MEHRYVEPGDRIGGLRSVDIDGVPPPTQGHADPVAPTVPFPKGGGNITLHRRQEAGPTVTRQYVVVLGESAQELASIESLEVVQDPVGRKNGQARIANVDEQHQHIVEGSVCRRLWIL